MENTPSSTLQDKKPTGRMTILKTAVISTIKSIRNKKSYNSIKHSSNNNRQEKPLKRKIRNITNEHIYE